MDDCYCPYCEKNNGRIDDCYEQNEVYETQCADCEKNFVFTVDYDISYDTSKAACLNGADHNYEKTQTFPPEFAKLRCTMCSHEKPLK